MTPQETRELLELAAYAVGLVVIQPHKIGPDDDPAIDYGGFELKGKRVYFNSLTNKADAFDLMVKLRLNVQVNDASIVVSWNWTEYEAAPPIYEYPRADYDEDFLMHYYGHDEATMLAITRAAAAIGKQKKESATCSQ